MQLTSTSTCNVNVRARNRTSVTTTQPRVTAPEHFSAEFVIVRVDCSAIFANVQVLRKLMTNCVDRPIVLMLFVAVLVRVCVGSVCATKEP